MPLIKIEHIGEAATLGIWKAVESADYFLHEIPAELLTGYDSGRFSENRKREFLASRFLLKRLLGGENARIEAGENGRLFLSGSNLNFSLSHSKEMMAVMLSETHHVGVDIEEIRERVKKVMRKFLNEAELNTLGNHPELWKITLCWSAKESIYKMMNMPGLAFADNIILEIPENASEGSLNARVKTSGRERHVAVNFQLLDGFVLTYCMNKK